MDPPPRIGRYDVERELGQGGMGRVLLARDSVLGRRVAIKILRDDLNLPPELKAQLFARMRQEARAAAAIGHPNMVTLHDMGEDDAVGLYLVFELIDGPTLRERLLDGALPALDVARLARELGAALTHAHGAGVVHRDVKPENVMLARTGAKLTDFGIARIPDSNLTTATTVLGTPAYTAPEALAHGDFSAHSDQFSLATTLYEALSGTRAFKGDDALAVANRVATYDPPPFSTRAEHARAAAVLARGMAKDKSRRFESCADFGDALATALERGSVDAFVETPPPRSSIVPRATRRWQNVIAALAVIVIVSLLFIGRRNQLAGVSFRDVAHAFDEATSPSAMTRLPQAPPAPPRVHPVPSTKRDTDAGAPRDIDAGATKDAAPADAAPSASPSTSSSAPPPASASAAQPAPSSS